MGRLSLGVSGGSSRCAGAGVVGVVDVKARKEVNALEIIVSFSGDAVGVTALAATSGGPAARMGDQAVAARVDASAVSKVAEEAVVDVTAATAIEAEDASGGGGDVVGAAMDVPAVTVVGGVVEVNDVSVVGTAVGAIAATVISTAVDIFDVAGVGAANDLSAATVVGAEAVDVDAVTVVGEAVDGSAAAVGEEVDAYVVEQVSCNRVENRCPCVVVDSVLSVVVVAVSPSQGSIPNLSKKAPDNARWEELIDPKKPAQNGGELEVGAQAQQTEESMTDGRGAWRVAWTQVRLGTGQWARVQVRPVEDQSSELKSAVASLSWCKWIGMTEVDVGHEVKLRMRSEEGWEVEELVIVVDEQLVSGAGGLWIPKEWLDSWQEQCEPMPLPHTLSEE